MKGRTFNFLTAVSLILCLSFTAMWVAALSHRYLLTFVAESGRAITLSNNPHQLVINYNGDQRWAQRVQHLPERGPSFVRHTWGGQQTYQIDADGLFGPGSSSLTANTLLVPTTEYPVANQWFIFGWRSHEYLPPSPRPATPTTYWFVNTPFWFLILLTVPLPARWAWRWCRRRRRLRQGLCLACGYDLRHSPGRCPECGLATAVPAVQSPA